MIAILTLTVPTFAQGQVGASRAANAAQGKTSSYIVFMADDPVIAYEGGVQGLPATKPGKGQKINPNSAHVKKYVEFLDKKHDNALKDAGVAASDKVHDYAFALNGFSALLTEAEAAEMAKQAGVLAVRPDEMRYKQTDSSPDFLGLTDPAGPWAKGLTGENVVVGVIDTGIWPEHPSFADDGSYGPSPVGPVPCEFGNTAQNPNDAPFECNNKLLGARQMLATYRAVIGADPDEYDSARDDDGHGTHTASTTAGNRGVEASIFGIPRGTISGIAPRARIIAYKGLGNLGGFSSDLAAAIDQAVADGVDVINYSIGGGASLTGADDIAFLFAADAGVFVATSAGNSGPGPGTIGGPASVPWITSVGASTQSRFFQGTVVLGDGSEYAGASITSGVGELPLVDAADAGDDRCLLPDGLDPEVVAGKIVLCRRGTNARAEKSLVVSQAGGLGMILYNNSDDDNLFTDNHWVPSVHVDNTPGLAIKDYTANDPNPTALIVGDQVSEWASAPSMTIFSSRGPDPVAEDIIKPDVTAPGIQILAGNSPTPDPDSTPPGELFQAIAGTSMSSPHVAGVFALLKQAHPDWSAAMAKSALMTTAYQDVRDNDRVSMAGPFAFGAGHINPGGRANKSSAFQPGLAYDAGFIDYLGFLCSAAPEVFANPEATCASLASIGIPLDPSDLNLPSIGIADLAGSQTIQRTVTSVAAESGWRDYSVTVEIPPGYDVSVSPSMLHLKKGMSATYYVTITNNGSAVIDEWSFGSLTWRDETGHYDVRSPIAVRAALFDAPAEISGSGESGSLSFDVKFGYTGDYTAAAHGLEPATVTSDNVLQDPDQNFDPDDGFSNLHQFTLSGAAFFRVAIPPEATEANADLDVYVYDPNGDLVASSTKGGTDEQVDIFEPEDGTWSVYVHGWSTPGGDSDYDMYSWVVSASPGGNLTIDSAPSSATIATTGTIDVSWTGATAGQWHLGAVSHSRGSELLGLTLVNVDNR
ncbi:MAG TPA: S8 family serine peptidase [Anaerolineales bacterium]|nr:S8 family serine peptidase [Anaerolineales bacterium]